ncbi:MAG: nucleoside-diphosphate sugar epimerase [Bdellovibrionales bacterium RIFOXYD1_FULL_53_11]|nr:MAG: nucleoside-diphosphate sugar epimerase [Bdellovibrionales bacterium RIFOXYD1_FULL_53_11]
MKIVVTGALGHIGSKLIRELPRLHPGCEVVMIDDFTVQRYPSLFDLPDGARYRFIEGDVIKLELPPVFEGADMVVHLAAITNAAGSFENKDRVEYINYNATLKTAEACAKTGVPMFYISTTSVYGTQEKLVDENCPESALQPQSPYAETKLREEKLLMQLGRERGLDFMICRFGTIYGASPGMRFHTAVNKFCWQAVMGQPVTVWRTALHQMRPYLFLDDAIRAMDFVLSKKLFDRGIYNVLTMNATVNTILDAIKMHAGNFNVEFVETKIMNQLSYEVARTKFERLGFVFSGADSLQKAVAGTVHLLGNANCARAK